MLRAISRLRTKRVTKAIVALSFFGVQLPISLMAAPSAYAAVPNGPYEVSNNAQGPTNDNNDNNNNENNNDEQDQSGLNDQNDQNGQNDENDQGNNSNNSNDEENADSGCNSACDTPSDQPPKPETPATIDFGHMNCGEENSLGQEDNNDSEDNEDCPPALVTPTHPSFRDMSCDGNGSYTIPETLGVDYEVDGAAADSGTYSVDSPETISVEAVAHDGYKLTGETSWSHEFKEADQNDCNEENVPPEEVADVCPNIAGVQEEIPSGMEEDENDNCVTPGQGGGEETPEVVTAVSLISAPTPPAVGGQGAGQLVNTGSNMIVSLAVGLSILGAALSLGMITKKPFDVTSSQTNSKIA